MEARTGVKCACRIVGEARFSAYHSSPTHTTEYCRVDVVGQRLKNRGQRLSKKIGENVLIS